MPVMNGPWGNYYVGPNAIRVTWVVNNPPNCLCVWYWHQDQITDDDPSTSVEAFEKLSLQSDDLGVRADPLKTLPVQNGDVGISPMALKRRSMKTHSHEIIAGGQE
jgi:hypothetical protein